MTSAEISVIIPARNEERLIVQTLNHVQAAVYRLSDLPSSPSCEVIVVDNGSTDQTFRILQEMNRTSRVKTVRFGQAGAARARNAGRRDAAGRILVFVDADTRICEDALVRVAQHCEGRDLVAGITLIGSLDGGMRSRLWWAFWNTVRRLPLSRAKAMPALMFCTAATFDALGGFDEDVAIGEEWPILAGLYRQSPQSVIYDRTIMALSSSRRMEQRFFGYTRLLLKYVWAILHLSGRMHYTDAIR